MLRVELHAHTSDDPVDRIPHTARELIDRAAALGYDALAITLHDRQLDVRPLVSYAADRGVTLIPGVERSIGGRHVLLINFNGGAEDVRSFDDIARLKRRSPGLVVAPHPFYPAPTCLRGMMDRHADLFDAVELNAMYTRTIDFNRRARQWAGRHGRPMVGNGDIHRLHQLGTTWSIVDADPHPDAICAAIAAGRVRVEHRPLSLVAAARTMAELLIADWRL
jgi:predicted metal-dependent phosphoesterase TrpH